MKVFSITCGNLMSRDSSDVITLNLTGKMLFENNFL